MSLLLFDFDGVLTDQTEEAARVFELFVSEIGASDDAKALAARGRTEVARTPHLHGWRSFDRISGYADEDLFVRNNGLAALLDDWYAAGDPAARRLGEALPPSGSGRFRSAAERAFDRLAAETKAGGHHPVEPGPVRALRTLRGKDHRIVIVSNSGTSRILDLLRKEGLDAVAHDEDPSAPIRVRGGAQKFTLSDSPAGYDVGPYRIHTDRPTYLQILREERPAAVVGDVFSLDLGLPAALARADADFRGLRLFLRVRPYTPAWSRNYMANGVGVPARLLDSLDEDFASTWTIF